MPLLQQRIATAQAAADCYRTRCSVPRIGCRVTVSQGNLSGLSGEVVGSAADGKWYVEPFDQGPGVLLAIPSHLLNVEGVQESATAPSGMAN